MRIFLYPAGLGVIGASQLVGFAGVSAWTLCSAAVFLLLAAGAGWRLARAGTRVAAEDKPPSSEAFTQRCAESFRVWARQIDTSRLTANDAVLNLTQVFEGTVEKLEAMLAAAAAALAEMRGHDGVMAAVGRGDEELRRAMQALVAAQKSREEKVGLYARDLREMADDVQNIAMQIRLLSFNAAVEAARAGKSAGGFSVVASEMRQLALVSGEKGAGMVNKVQAISATLEDFVRGERSVTHSEVDSVAEAEHSIQEVTQRFRQLATVLSDAVHVMEAKTGEVHGDISDALVAMQFQDRVSQIQQHVVGGLKALGERLVEDGVDGFDAGAWEARMARDLSTAEEFDNLRGRDASTKRRSHEMTFF